MKANGYVKDDYLEIKEWAGCSKTYKTQRNTIYKIFLEYERRKEDKYHGHMDLEDYALKLLRELYSRRTLLDYIFVDEIQIYRL